MAKIKNNIDSRLVNLQNKVAQNLNKLPDFDINFKLDDVNTNSCFDFQKGKLTASFDFIPDIDNSKKDVPKYKSKIVDLIVNQHQRSILNDWFNSYIDMYNVVIHYFKNYKTQEFILNLKWIYDSFNTEYKTFKTIENNNNSLVKDKKRFIKSYQQTIKKKKNNKNKDDINKLTSLLKEIKEKIKINNIQLSKLKIKVNKISKIKNTEEAKLNKHFNWKRLRTYFLKDIRDHIQLKSSVNNNNKIRTHVLDTAIKMACTSYKSCISNFLNGNIKKFKIRYWRHNKKKKILEIEKEFIINNKIFYKVFGDFNYKYNGKDYKLENETLKILYDVELNKYYLLISEKIKKQDSKSTKYIAIDQGITPFMSCRTNDELMSFGTNTSKIVSGYLKRIDTINNAKDLLKKEKRKKERKYYLKIKNKIDETHW